MRLAGLGALFLLGCGTKAPDGIAQQPQDAVPERIVTEISDSSPTGPRTDVPSVPIDLSNEARKIRLHVVDQNGRWLCCASLGDLIGPFERSGSEMRYTAIGDDLSVAILDNDNRWPEWQDQTMYFIPTADKQSLVLQSIVWDGEEVANINPRTGIKSTNELLRSLFELK